MGNNSAFLQIAQANTDEQEDADVQVNNAWDLSEWH